MADQPARDLFISAVTEAELHHGVALLPPGKQQGLLAAATKSMLTTGFAGRILPLDSPAAVAYAGIVARRRWAGRPMSPFDAQIAATARSRGYALATRNVRNSEGCGVAVVNPWTEAASG